MADKDWDKIIADEDRLIQNSDRKQRYHFVSLDAMSEETASKHSMAVYNRGETNSDNFIDSVKNPKLKKALRNLKPNQRTIVELHFEHNLKQREIAEILGCSEANVSKIMSRTLNKIKKSMT